MHLVAYLNVFLSAFFASVIAVPLLRRWAVQVGQLDQPAERKVHRRAVPRIGGVAIVLSFLFTVFVFLDISKELRGLLTGLLVIFIVGLLDDLVHLSARQKLLGQIAAALLTVVISGLHISDLGNLFGFGPILLPVWVAIPFTVFAVVGVTNAMNMIDGLDGLAGGISTIALGAFLLLFYESGNQFGMSISVALIGSLFGFLKHNSYPARIFMGDAGSLSLGFLLSFLAVYMTQQQGSTVSPSVPVLILGLPIVDTLKVMGQRMLKGKSPFSPDMTHVHHDFLDLGLDHRFTVLLIYIYSFFWAIFAVVFRNSPAYILLSLYLLTFIIVYMVIRYVRLHPDQFGFIKKDSPRSLRESNAYLRIVRFTQWVTPVLLLLLLGYMLFSIFVCVQVGLPMARMSLVFFFAGIVLALLPEMKRKRFETIYHVAVSLLLILLSEWQCHLSLGFAIDYRYLSNVLFVVIAILVTIKIVFRSEDDVYLSAPLDYLFLAMVLSLVAVPGDLALTHRIPVAVMKAIFFILALKIISVQSRINGRILFWGLQLALVAIFVRNVLFS